MTALTEAEATERKLYNGWRVLGVTMVVSFFSSVMAQLFLGAMLPHIQEDTGWSRSSITLAVTFGSMLAGFASPIFGRLADKHGPRLLSAIGLLLTVVCLYGMGLSASVHVGAFGVAYVLGRAISQNTLSGIVARTTAVNWFRRMRGRALGMTGVAVPFGGALLIPVATLMMDSGLSWSMVYYCFGAFLLLLLAPILLVLRRRPEDMGLLPDGDSAPGDPVHARHDPYAGEHNWTLQAAMRTSAFWLMIAAMTIGVCAQGAIGFHMFAYFKDQGVSGGAAALCIFLLAVDTPGEAIAFAILFGLAARGEGSIIVAMEANYFGRGSFGAISGFAAPFTQVSLGIGPTIAAICYDSTDGSYTIAFLAFAVMFTVSAALLWLAKKPAPTPEMLADARGA